MTKVHSENNCICGCKNRDKAYLIFTSIVLLLALDSKHRSIDNQKLIVNN